MALSCALFWISLRSGPLAARCIGPAFVGVAAAHPTGWVAPASLLLAGSWVLARVAAGPVRPAATDTPDRAGRAGGPPGS